MIGLILPLRRLERFKMAPMQNGRKEWWRLAGTKSANNLEIGDIILVSGK